MNQPANIPEVTLRRSRIESIDLLKGLVMVIMVLDHVRDYFHSSAYLFDPSDPEMSTLSTFFTRWITDFCAPAFAFLAGLSAYIAGQRKTPHQLSVFLMKRGFWLVLIEITIVTFGWHFDLYFRNIILQTIWSLGMSMILLAGLVHLKRKIILVLSLVIIFGHNLLDTLHFTDSVLGSILHERNRFAFAEGHYFVTAYPLLPWIAVLFLGYCVGPMYDSSFVGSKRQKILNRIGAFLVVLFLLLTGINGYGDPVPWKYFDDTSKTIISILSTTKYPPSLLFLLSTLGGTFLFLANSENIKGAFAEFFRTLGRTPFLFYILHIYLVHILALFAAEFTGYGWRTMILTKFVTRSEELKGYGFHLWVVYVVWISVLILLYPLCKRFDSYKQNNKQKWWLSYL